jgi:hypothetical protein
MNLVTVLTDRHQIMNKVEEGPIRASVQKRSRSYPRSKVQAGQGSAHRKRSIQANNKARAIKNAKRVFLYLLAHPCHDCGEKDPVVLESIT